MEVKQRTVGLTLALAFIMAVAPSFSWPSRHHDLLVDDEIKVVHHRSYCVRASGKCFSSGQCCNDLVCAAIDDYFGQKPEVPGYCVKEKDLEVCATSAECGDGGRCVSLGRTGERYCLPHSEDNGRQNALQAASPAAGHTQGATGGLGAACSFSAECRPHTDNGVSKLCCQKVSRGRQGVRRICDRVTPISQCISAPRK